MQMSQTNGGFCQQITVQTNSDGIHNMLKRNQNKSFDSTTCVLLTLNDVGDHESGAGVVADQMTTG